MPRCREEGVVVSLGHTNSDYAAASAALRGNFTHVTHTFNAQSGFHHREPGVFGAILASNQVTAELIADNIHVHPGAMKILLRCLGVERVALITDAMAATGLQDGTYNLVGQTVHVKDGQATLSDGTLAGSTALMNQCVQNINQSAGVPLAEAVKMATLVTGASHRFCGQAGQPHTGREANLTVIDQNVNVRLTFVRGKVVYANLWRSSARRAVYAILKRSPPCLAEI